MEVGKGWIVLEKKGEKEKKTDQKNSLRAIKDGTTRLILPLLRLLLTALCLRHGTLYYQVCIIAFPFECEARLKLVIS